VDMEIKAHKEYDYSNLGEDKAIKLTPQSADENIRELVIEKIQEFVDDTTDNGEEYRNDKPEKLHEYIDPDRVEECKNFVSEGLQTELYDWAVSCCENRLGFENDFYVDKEIFVRINIPFDYGMEGTRPTEQSSETPVEKWKRFVRSAVPGLSPPQQSSKAVEYNKNRPASTHSHGPHVDTWYGHSFTATNLWFSVCGVNTASSMVFYPDKFDKDIPYDPEFMYVAEDVDRRSPVEIDLEDGENLVFNPELLHSTRLNTSDETRIVITLRISEEEPLFSNETTHEHTHNEWIVSSDIKDGRIAPQTVGEYVDKPDYESVEIEEPVRIELDKSIAELRDTTELDDERIRSQERNTPFTLTLDGTDYTGVKMNDSLYVTTSNCPHVGLPLERGSVHDSKLKCPEHGAEFDLETGECVGESCSSLRISVVEVPLAT
jgi:nitrite reductase/ring-hydroxylating ferredoxin subunit